MGGGRVAVRSSVRCGGREEKEGMWEGGECTVKMEKKVVLVDRVS